MGFDILHRMDLGTTLSLLAVLAVGLVLGAALGVLLTHRRGGDPALSQRRAVAEAATRAADAAVVRDSLDRLHDQLRDMAQHGVSWQSQLKQQVDDVRHSTDVLRRETASLSTALRKPQVRGRWGELHLRRVVELAGLVDRCDFAEQVTALGRGRPAAGPTWWCTWPAASTSWSTPRCRSTRSSTRAPSTRATASRTRERDAHLSRHARQLRQHVDALAAQGLLARAAVDAGVRGAVRARASRSCPLRSRPSRPCWSTPPTSRSCWPRRRR